MTGSFGRVALDNGYDAFSLDNDRNTRSDEPGRDEQETNYGSVAVAHDFSDTLRLDVTAGVSDSRSTTGTTRTGRTSAFIRSGTRLPIATSAIGRT